MVNSNSSSQITFHDANPKQLRQTPTPNISASLTSCRFFFLVLAKPCFNLFIFLACNTPMPNNFLMFSVCCAI